MAFDTIAVTPGSGADIAGDIVDGDFLQVVKVDLGGEGASLPLVGKTLTPNSTDVAMPVRVVGEDIVSASFTDSGSGLLSPNMTLLRSGTGVTVNQSVGNLVVTTGTGANQEFLARSNVTVRGSWLAKLKLSLSQRIANQNFMWLLADLFGTNLAYTNTASAVTVTKTAHGLTAANVGQGMFLGGITASSGTAIPARWTITSVPDANTIVFGVTSWVTGAGTLNLFGWNHVKVQLNGTVNTLALFATQRNGWTSTDASIATPTTATGFASQLHCDGRSIVAADTLTASTLVPNVTTRGNSIENIPDEANDLYLFIWAYNSSTAPVSTTTLTVGFWSLERYSNTPVYLAGSRPMGTSSPLAVQVVGTITGSVTADTEMPSATPLGDAVGNPSTSMVGANGLMFNNASWDRVRNNVNSTVADTGVKIASFNGATITNYNGKSFLYSIILGAVSGTTPSLTVTLQWSPDGTNWFAIPGASMVPFTAGSSFGALVIAPGCTPVANQVIDHPAPRFLRAVYTITGTTPSFTISNVFASFTS